MNEITAYPAPLVSFSSSFDEVTNLVTFTNSSTIPSGIIATWEWDFGDATFSNLFEPTHIYSTPNTTSLAPCEKSKFLGSGGSMVARLKLKGIDGRAPPGVEPAA